MKDVLAVVLAGGKGSRLEPLTRDRAKPAVPFGGVYRIIDFTLSNCLNSGLRRMLVLTQYKAMSLDRHITLGWRNYLCRELGEFIDVVPPQQRIDEHWYQGTADAVYQNIYTLEKERPEYVVILAGDHIYKMDYGKLVEFHQENERRSDDRRAARAGRSEPRQFGVMQVDDDEPDRRLRGEAGRCRRRFPATRSTAWPRWASTSSPPGSCSSSCARTRRCPDSAHDFGRNIIPVDHRHAPRVRLSVSATRTASRTPTGATSARSTPTIEANMDLIAVDPLLNLYDDHWPIRTYQPNLPPPNSCSTRTTAAARRTTASSAPGRSSPAAR